LLKGIAKLVLALNGNIKKSQVASGVAWGVLLGLVPAGNFFWIVLFIVSFFFRHNHGAKIFGMAIVKCFAPILVYRLHAFGEMILYTESLRPFFTSMYNLPFVPFTKFNNTVVMGGLAGGVILWIPIFALFMLLIPLYRNHLGPKIRESKLVKTIVKFPLYRLVEKALIKE